MTSSTTTIIQCDCGQFKAELSNFPKASPGRCVCYCDDCQTYLNYLGRPNLMDQNGGTEIIPVYPKNFRIMSGQHHLNCTRLSPKGLWRWWASCCKTPVGNTTPGFPWVGLLPVVFKNINLEQALGPIRSRIQGKFAKGTPPEGTSMKVGLSDAKVVLPFMLKGFLLGKGKDSPFFDSKGTPVTPPEILTLEQRNKYVGR